MINMETIKALEYVLSNTRPRGIKQGKDGKWYVTLECKGATNYPTLVFKELPSKEVKK